VRSFTVKEIKTFRDQPSGPVVSDRRPARDLHLQLRCPALEKSPIQTVYLRNLFSFLNMGLALFVLTAVTPASPTRP
jgi:hypothetical protein